MVYLKNSSDLSETPWIKIWILLELELIDAEGKRVETVSASIKNRPELISWMNGKDEPCSSNISAVRSWPEEQENSDIQ